MPDRPIALVTGASSGIGLSYARQLAGRGHDLVLVARRAERLEEVARELEAAHRASAEILPADLETDAGIDVVAARLLAQPAIALLVNNAGFAARAPVAELDESAFEAMLRVNVLALARLSRAAMKAMVDAGSGAIVNIASGTAFMQMPGNAGYGATKNFVVGFTRTMQVEAQGSGVAVQLLIPGVIATDFHRVAGNDLARFPPERVMDADDLVAASLRALEMGEPVCIPSLPDIRDWDAYVAAERALAANVSKDRVADRYRVR